MTTPLFQHQKQEEHCPQCGALLQIKQSKKGLFLGCSAYPACDYLRPLQRTEYKVLKELDELCPECQHPLQLKQGHFGMFIGCSHYPDCHFVVHEQPSEKSENLPCPDCGKGRLVARRGRQGKLFYGCNRFPQCKFLLPSKPYAQPCPECHFPLAMLKNENAEKSLFVCGNKTCKTVFAVMKTLPENQANNPESKK